jgi:hypothetical protein
VASVPENPTVTAARYQPFAFGCRSGVAVAWGAVSSYLIASDRVTVLPAKSRHAPDTTAFVESGPE